MNPEQGVAEFLRPGMKEGFPLSHGSSVRKTHCRKNLRVWGYERGNKLLVYIYLLDKQFRKGKNNHGLLDIFRFNKTHPNGNAK